MHEVDSFMGNFGDFGKSEKMNMSSVRGLRNAYLRFVTWGTTFQEYYYTTVSVSESEERPKKKLSYA